MQMGELNISLNNSMFIVNGINNGETFIVGSDRSIFLK